MGETNLSENISSRIETLLVSSNHDTEMKQQWGFFYKDFFLGISFETRNLTARQMLVVGLLCAIAQYEGHNFHIHFKVAESFEGSIRVIYSFRSLIS